MGSLTDPSLLTCTYGETDTPVSPGLRVSQIPCAPVQLAGPSAVGGTTGAWTGLPGACRLTVSSGRPTDVTHSPVESHLGAARNSR